MNLSMVSRRVIAFIIDFIIATILSIIVTMFIDIVYIITKATPKLDIHLIEKVGSLPLGSLIGNVIAFFFLTLKDYVSPNGSIGKRFMKIRVEKQDDSRLTYLDCLKRSLTYLILPVEGYFILIEVERLGDRWAETTVVLTDENQGKRR